MTIAPRQTSCASASRQQLDPPGPDGRRAGRRVIQDLRDGSACSRSWLVRRCSRSVDGQPARDMTSLLGSAGVRWRRARGGSCEPECACELPRGLGPSAEGRRPARLLTIWQRGPLSSRRVDLIARGRSRLSDGALIVQHEHVEVCSQLRDRAVSRLPATIRSLRAGLPRGAVIRAESCHCRARPPSLTSCLAKSRTPPARTARDGTPEAIAKEHIAKGFCTRRKGEQVSGLRTTRESLPRSSPRSQRCAARLDAGSFQRTGTHHDKPGIASLSPDRCQASINSSTFFSAASGHVQDQSWCGPHERSTHCLGAMPRRETSGGYASRPDPVWCTPRVAGGAHAGSTGQSTRDAWL